MSAASKKIFRQWLIGYFLTDFGKLEITDVDFDMEKFKDAQDKANHILGVLIKLEENEQL